MLSAPSGFRPALNDRYYYRCNTMTTFYILFISVYLLSPTLIIFSGLHSCQKRDDSLRSSPKSNSVQKRIQMSRRYAIILVERWLVMQCVMTLWQDNPPVLQPRNPPWRCRQMTPLVKLVCKRGIHSSKQRKRVKCLIKQRQTVESMKAEQIRVECHRKERCIRVRFDKVVIAHGSRINMMFSERPNESGTNDRSVKTTP